MDGIIGSMDMSLSPGVGDGQHWRRKWQPTPVFLPGEPQEKKRQKREAPGAGDGQGSLACCSPWGRKESDTTE